MGSDERPLLRVSHRLIGREVPIGENLACAGCGYNLRTLHLDALCPECGHPVVESVRAADAKGESIANQLFRASLQPIARKVGYPVDGVMFVVDAVARGARIAAANGHPGDVKAQDICQAVRELALGYFNDRAEALELLDEWGIRRGEDVGAIVFALVAEGRLRASPADQQSDFDGLFTLETLL